jgi:DNA repair photolyase
LKLWNHDLDESGLRTTEPFGPIQGNPDTSETDCKQRNQTMNVTPCTDRPILEPCTLQGRNYQIDPYIGCEHHCYYCYALNQAESDWTQQILIHQDISTRLESELAAIPPQTIYMGWQTDGYQPCEEKYLQTRQVLELLLAKGFSASILTKSDLVLRDAELLQKMDGAMVSVSVAFNDNDVRRQFEAGTMDTEARINALKELHAAGLRTSALICPVVPYITDIMPLIDMLAPHTDKIWIYGLHMSNRTDPNWLNVERILKNHYPDLIGQIENVVFSKNHSYWEKLRHALKKIQKYRKLNLSIHV